MYIERTRVAAFDKAAECLGSFYIYRSCWYTSLLLMPLSLATDFMASFLSCPMDM